MNTSYLFFCGDVSGSMQSPYEKTYNISQNSPKSESLFEIFGKSIKILSRKKQQVLASSLLFGCIRSPITDFLLLIDFIIDNIQFIKQFLQEDLQDRNTNFRELLIKLLENAGANKISNYMYERESPSDEECKFFYKILKDKPNLVEKIIEDLPSAAKSSISSSMVTGGTYIPLFGYYVENSKKENIRNETLKIKRNLENNFSNYYGDNTFLQKLNSYNWDVGTPIEKTSDEILKKIKKLFNEFQKEQNNNNIFSIFKKYIYGNTPLCSCLKKSIEFLKNKEYNANKILIIITDGNSSDGDPLEIYNRYKSIKNLYIVGGYISNSIIQNEKTLFDNLSSSDKGAEQLFKISSEVETDSIAFDYLRDKGWSIPPSGKCKLFIQMNNTNNINDFLYFLNKLIDGTEDVLGDILGVIKLKELTGKNISNFEITNQTMGNCYLHATRNIIRMARARIYPPNIPDPDALEKEIINEFPYQYDEKGEVKGRNTYEVLQKMAPKYRLHVNQIIGDNMNEIEKKVKLILLRKRPIVLSFRLTKQQWKNFCNFFGADSPNKMNIITYEEINKNVPKNDKDGGGHATVITKINKDCFTVLNSWGDKWGDNGFFKIKDFSIFSSFRCFDVFFTLKDLTEYEKNEYQKLVEKQKKEFLEDY